jgi:hypothetical protein
MFTAMRHERGLRALFAVLLVCVLALRMVVPTGFMPTRTADGIVVTICNGLGESQTVLVDLQRSDDQDHSGHEQAEHKPCVFASASLPAIAGAQPAPLAKPALLLREFALPPPVDAAPATADFLTPPLRGPPALA